MTAINEQLVKFLVKADTKRLLGFNVDQIDVKNCSFHCFDEELMPMNEGQIKEFLDLSKLLRTPKVRIEYEIVFHKLHTINGVYEK